MLAGPDLLERPRLCADLRDGVHAVPRVGLPRIALALGRWGLALGPDGSVYVSDERRAVVSRPRSGRMLLAPESLIPCPVEVLKLAGAKPKQPKTETAPLPSGYPPQMPAEEPSRGYPGKQPAAAPAAPDARPEHETMTELQRGRETA